MALSQHSSSSSSRVQKEDRWVWRQELQQLESFDMIACCKRRRFIRRNGHSVDRGGYPERERARQCSMSSATLSNTPNFFDLTANPASDESEGTAYAGSQGLKGAKHSSPKGMPSIKAQFCDCIDSSWMHCWKWPTFFPSR